MINLLISDFDGVFTDNAVYINENGLESVKCCRADGIGIAKLLNFGIDFIVCSSEKVDCVTHRAKKIGFKAYLGIDDKGRFISKYIEENNLNPANVAYLGNDINDLSAFEVVGYRIAVSDSYPEIIKMADKVLQKKGGYGVVREACEHLINISS
tara:strand:- start:341 stop:802 length:462 start_codon:yes stop_codon:yes gene_type:complete